MDPKTAILEFGNFRIDPGNAQLFKAGVRVSLEPKAFRVLVFLAERAGRLVEKDELLSAIWQDTFVTENALTREIVLLRKALGDNKGAAKYIETAPRRGYRFIAPVTVRDGNTLAAPNGGGEPSPARVFADEDLPRRILRRHLFAVIVTSIVLAAAIGAISIVMRARPHKTGLSAESRPLQITSSTGLDLYPSFSPDGSAIAYSSDANGNFEIYLKQLTPGGRVIQLTNDGERNMQPAWSPDGSSVAYCPQNKGGIWVMPALGGTARQLTTFGSGPAWSPDGREIVFQSGTNNDLGATAGVSVAASTLWVVSVRNGETRQLTQPDNPVGAHNSPSWSPDGKNIVFVTGGITSSRDLWSVSADGRSMKLISSHGAFLSPVYARDGQSIYAGVLRSASDFGLWRIPVEQQGGDLGSKIFSSIPAVGRHLAIDRDGKRIAFSIAQTISNLYSLPMAGDHTSDKPVALTQDTRLRKTAAMFSPDGKRILLGVTSADADPGVWMMDADGAHAVPVTNHCSLPLWLPGGEDFACVSGADTKASKSSSGEAHSLNFWRFHIGTGTLEKIRQLNQDGEFFDITRDGKNIAFTSQAAGPPNVWVASLEGGEARQVTFDREMVGFPAWSPDGKQLAVEMRRADSTQIALVTQRGPPVQLTHDPGESWPHSWSPDGRRIAFAGLRSGVWNIWWVSAMDGAEKQLTQYTGFNHYVRYPTWSPTGKAIVYEYGENRANIWMLPIQ